MVPGCKDLWAAGPPGVGGLQPGVASILCEPS